MPLIDHRVVEFAWRLSPDQLIANGEGKRPLRAVLDRYVPRALVDRPKMGFGIPLGVGSADRCGRGPRICCRPVRSPTGCSIRRAVRRCFEDFMSGRGRDINALVGGAAVPGVAPGLCGWLAARRGAVHKDRLI